MEQSSGSAAFEFTNQQNETIRRLASRMKVLGWVYIIQGMLIGLFGIIVLLALPMAGFLYFVVTAVTLLIGIWTKSAATSFDLIVWTKGSDINHLMQALDSLRKLYNLQFWILIAGVAFVVVGIIVALVVGVNSEAFQVGAAT